MFIIFMSTAFRCASVLSDNARRNYENEQGRWRHYIRKQCHKIIFAY